MNRPLDRKTATVFLSVSLGTGSLLLAAVSGLLVLLSLAIRSFLDTTPPGGSGEFQGINHFAPALFLGLVCIPGIILSSLAGLSLGVTGIRKSERLRSTTVGVVINVIISIGWLIRFMDPAWNYFMNVLHAFKMLAEG